MKENAVEKRRRLIDEFAEQIQKICGADSYESAITMLREKQFSDKRTSPAHWYHKQAREIYPTDPPDSVQPEYFYEILERMDTREKLHAAFSTVPTNEVDRFLNFMFEKLFPAVRLDAGKMVKTISQRHHGGRKKIVRSDEQRREIYDKVEELARKVGKGIAQKRVADKYGLALRTVQRICKEQKDKMRTSNSDVLEPDGL